MARGLKNESVSRNISVKALADERRDNTGLSGLGAQDFLNGPSKRDNPEPTTERGRRRSHK